MFAEQELQLLEDKVFTTLFNTTSVRDHVPEVELQIQVIKERIRAHHANLTFPRSPQSMTTEPAKNIYCSSTYSPPKAGSQQPTAREQL